MNFPCTGCGCCCKVINWADKIVVRDDPDHPLYFPYTHNEGVCEKLIDNKCSVYETRPALCRIGVNIPEWMPIDQYYEQNIAACNKLIDLFGLGDEWRPTIS
jgi:hypothetical protein